MKQFLFLISLIVLVILAAWYGLVTQSRVLSLTERLIYPYGYSCELKGFNNIVPFRLYVDRLVLKRRPGSHLTGQNMPLTHLFKQLEATGFAFTHISLRVNPLTLSINFNSRIFNGYLAGQVGLFKDFLVRIEDIDMQKVGQVLGVEIGGLLKGEIVSNKWQFWLRDAHLVDIVIGDRFLPLGLFSDIKSTLTLGEGLIEIDQIFLVGKEGKARIKGGRLSRNGIDLIAVFMPTEDALWSALLKRYRIKKGYYRIPIKKRWSPGK